MIFKDIHYCLKFREIVGHHEEKLELKQLLSLRVYLSDTQFYNLKLDIKQTKKIYIILSHFLVMKKKYCTLIHE